VHPCGAVVLQDVRRRGQPYPEEHIDESWPHRSLYLSAEL
jgi:hypothetical protein